MTGDPAPPALPSISPSAATTSTPRGALQLDGHRRHHPSPPHDLSRDGCNVDGRRPAALARHVAQLHYIPDRRQRLGRRSRDPRDAVADFGLSELARRLGDNATRRQFLARAQYWKNVFNPRPPDGGYIQDRNADGTWPAFTPASHAAASPRAAPRSTPGWSRTTSAASSTAMGGNATAVSRLDTLLPQQRRQLGPHRRRRHQSELDNEPSIGAPWLYDFAGRPERRRRPSPGRSTRCGPTTPRGIPGQDDLGAMSAWYVWAAMGLYPQTPGRAELVLASPLFPPIEIRRPHGDISIRATGAAADAPYIHCLKVNGKPTTKTWLAKAS